MIAAYLPARRAGRIAPVAAMRDDVALPESSLRRRLLGRRGLVVVGHRPRWCSASSARAARAAADRPRHAGDPGRRLADAPGARVVPSSAGLGVVFRRVFGTVGVLATQNSLRNPRRTAATASALMIGLTLVALMSILGQSAKASTDKAIDGSSLTRAARRVQRDPAHRSRPAIAEQIRRRRGRYGRAVPSGGGQGRRLHGVFLGAADPDQLAQALNVDMTPDRSGPLDGDPRRRSRWPRTSDLAGRRHVTLEFQTDRPLKNTRRRASSPPFDAGDLRHQSRHAREGRDQAARTRCCSSPTEPGADDGRCAPRSTTVLADHPTVTLKDPSGVRRRAEGADRHVPVHHLRAARAGDHHRGARHHQHARAVGDRANPRGRPAARGRDEPATAAADGAAGVGGDRVARRGARHRDGHGLRRELQRAIADRGLDVLSIPWCCSWCSSSSAALVGVLAAVLPARRAAKLDVLEAITTE